MFDEIVTENFELTSTDINDDDDDERCTSRAETTFSEPTDYEEVGQEVTFLIFCLQFILYHFA